MSAAVWLLMGWVVVTPAKTDIVTVNSRGLNIYRHDTRTECFERPSILEDLVAMDDIRDIVVQNLDRRTLPPVKQKALDKLIDKYLGRFIPPLPPVHVSDLRGGFLFDKRARYRAFCVKFEPRRYRDA